MKKKFSILLILLLSFHAFGKIVHDNLNMAADGATIIWRNNSQAFTIAASPTMSESVNYIWPAADATAGGQALLSDAAGVLSFGVPTTSASHDLMSATHTDTTNGTPPARGSMIVGNATPLWAEFVLGANQTVWVSDGTDPSWGTVDISGGTNLSVTTPITLTGDSIGIVNQGTTTTVLHGDAAGNAAFSAVVLGTDTSGNYVQSITDGDNGIDGGDGGSVAAALTLSFDATELDALTWSDGANATNTWTYDVSGTDTTMIFGSDIVTFSGNGDFDGFLAVGSQGVFNTTRVLNIDTEHNLTSEINNIFSTFDIGGTGTIAAARVGFFAARMRKSTGTITEFSGIRTRAVFNQVAGASVTDFRTFWADQVVGTSYTGTITNYINFDSGPIANNAGTNEITNAYGVRIGAINIFHGGAQGVAIGVDIGDIATNNGDAFAIRTGVAPILAGDALWFTQTDGAERIDSDADGTLDLYAGTSIDLHQNTILTDGLELRFNEADNSNYVGFKAPTLTGNQIWTLPTADGSDNDIIKTNGSGILSFVTATSHTQISFSMYDAEPARGSETSLDGAFIVLATAQPLNSVPTDLVISKGTGKIIVVVNAGSDIAGSITVTGTSVDRDTGATTGSDTDILTIDALTTDGSDTDANGNTRHAFTGAYITSEWFVGTVTLSTTNLTLTDVDVYHVSFEQFDDTADITLDTFDANILTTNVNAEFDAYLYSIMVTADKCNIEREASLNVGAGGETALADRYWRLRRGNINKALDGTTDGTWVDIHYSNSPAYVEDVSIKVWATEVVPLTLTP